MSQFDDMFRENYRELVCYAQQVLTDRKVYSISGEEAVSEAYCQLQGKSAAGKNLGYVKAVIRTLCFYPSSPLRAPGAKLDLPGEFNTDGVTSEDLHLQVDLQSFRETLNKKDRQMWDIWVAGHTKAADLVELFNIQPSARTTVYKIHNRQKELAQKFKEYYYGR